jgi:hypothetical protein
MVNSRGGINPAHDSSRSLMTLPVQKANAGADAT